MPAIHNILYYTRWVSVNNSIPQLMSLNTTGDSNRQVETVVVIW